MVHSFKHLYPCQLTFYLVETKILKHRIEVLDGLMEVMKHEMLTLQTIFAVMRGQDAGLPHAVIQMAVEDAHPAGADTSFSAGSNCALPQTHPSYIRPHLNNGSLVDFVTKHSSAEGISGHSL
jgi:hypothetical protein